MQINFAEMNGVCNGVVVFLYKDDVFTDWTDNQCVNLYVQLFVQLIPDLSFIIQSLFTTQIISLFYLAVYKKKPALRSSESHHLYIGSKHG